MWLSNQESNHRMHFIRIGKLRHARQAVSSGQISGERAGCYSLQVYRQCASGFRVDEHNHRANREQRVGKTSEQGTRSMRRAAAVTAASLGGNALAEPVVASLAGRCCIAGFRI